MTTNARSARLVTSIAVVAVTIAAIAATVATLGEREDDAAPAGVQARRPAADEPVRVIKAPPEQPALQQPVRCPECDAPPLRGGRL